MTGDWGEDYPLVPVARLYSRRHHAKAQRRKERQGREEEKSEPQITLINYDFLLFRIKLKLRTISVNQLNMRFVF